MEKEKTLGQEVREMLRILVISLAIVLPVRFFIAQPFIVRGASMEPTFEDGEYLIVDEISYRFGSPTRGETIVFRYPGDPKQFFIKRIIGLPGETVIIRDGHVSIKDSQGDERSIEESYVPQSMSTVPNEEKTLGKDEYFVLGDNRENSLDSRRWGPLSEQYIVGRVFIRLWPIGRFSIL